MPRSHLPTVLGSPPIFSATSACDQPRSSRSRFKSLLGFPSEALLIALLFLPLLPTTSRNEMHFSTKWLQTMLRCIRLISGKAALSHYCHQTSGVNHIPGEADSCKVVISLREVVGPSSVSLAWFRCNTQCR